MNRGCSATVNENYIFGANETMVIFNIEMQNVL